MDDSTDAMPVVAPPAPAAAAPKPRRGGIVAALALLALALAGYAAWRGHALEAASGSAAELQRLDAQVQALAHNSEQLRGSIEALRARAEDGEKVDKSERETLLSLGERARLLEDAVANLADKRLSGRDALLLNEAELLLTLGDERYVLFGDAREAVAAYRLADTALSEVEDAAFSTVRQSITAEIEALSTARDADPAPLAARLARLRERIPELTPVTHLPAPAPDDSRLWRVLGAFVQVHHANDAHAQMSVRDAGIARELTELDAREAQAALLARDDAGYHAALAALRRQLQAFDPDAAATTAVRAELDGLDKAMLRGTLPTPVGAALKELRNLRATRGLRAPAPVSGTAS